MPPLLARGIAVRNNDSSRYRAGVSESIHSADVLLEIAIHSFLVGWRRTRSGLLESGSSVFIERVMRR